MSLIGAFPKSAGMEGASRAEPITDTHSRRHGERPSLGIVSPANAVWVVIISCKRGEFLRALAELKHPPLVCAEQVMRRPWVAVWRTRNISTCAASPRKNICYIGARAGRASSVRSGKRPGWASSVLVSITAGTAPYRPRCICLLRRRCECIRARG